MEEKALTLKPIATIHTDFPTKFGVPRQSGVVEALEAEIVFLPAYRQEEAFRGLDGFTHLWLIWGFSQAVREGWSATVRPPRLGGNEHMGVFATRSPYRPNPLGLSSVRLRSVDSDPKRGVVLHVSGADLMDGTPIYDIKPYIGYTDSHPEAVGGFTDAVAMSLLEVDCPAEVLSQIPENKRSALMGVLANDPRPRYQHDPNRVYGFYFSDYEVKFTVEEPRLIVRSLEKVRN